MIDYMTFRRVISCLVHPGRSRIGYVGWTGYRNLGDESLYDAVNLLLKGYSLYPCNRKTRNNPLLGLLENRGLLTSCCLGGGTLIYSGNTNYDIVRKALQRRLPVFSLGTGVIEPVWAAKEDEQEKHLKKWNDIMKQFSSISVRGPRSKEILERCGINHVEVVGDPALIFSTVPVHNSPNRSRILGVNIGTSRGNVWGHNENHIITELAEAIRLVQEKGWEVRIFSVWPEDDKTCRQLAKKINLSTGHIQKHYINANKFLQAAGQCSVFVGMKLHPVILACCAQVPSIMLEYQPKCADFMDSMEIRDYNIRVDSMEAAHVADLIMMAYGNKDALRLHLKNISRYYVEKLLDFSSRQIDLIQEHLS